MKTDIIWTRSSFAQLESLPQAIAFDILGRVDLLASFPEMGVSLRSRYAQLQNCRQLIVDKSHRVIYEYDADAGVVYVLAVQHCRQKLPSAREMKRKAEPADE